MDRNRVALFIDVDNLLLSAQNSGLPFQLDTIVGCAQGQGTLAFCRAYADWSGNRPRMRDFHRLAIEMVELPSGLGNKNTADIQLALDAFELVLSQRSPDVIVIASGDRDFVPLVQKLRRYAVKVVGIGIEGAVSGVLQRACDQFISYDSLLPPAPVPALDRPTEPTLEDGFALLARALKAVDTNEYVASHAQVRALMQDFDASFSLERLRITFDEFLARAQQAGWIRFTQTKAGPVIELIRIDRTGAPHDTEREYRYGTPEEAAESYRQILIEKRVPLLPWSARERLVRYLWSMFAETPGLGLSFAKMGGDLVIFASSSDLNVPVPAIHKLLYTLNIAHCFSKDGAQGCYYPNPDLAMDHFIPMVTADEALDLMNRVYVKGIHLQHPEAPLQPEGLALLLFGEINDPAVEQVRKMVDLGARLVEPVVSSRGPCSPTLSEVARISESLDARFGRLLREVVELAQQTRGSVPGALAKQLIEAKDPGMKSRLAGKKFREFVNRAEQAGYIEVVDVPGSDFLLRVGSPVSAK